MIDWNKVIVASDDDTVQVVCGKSIFFAVSRAAGIDRVQKTSTSGLVDTYTMYRTDDTVAGTFTVTNGRVTEIHICSSNEYDAQTLIPTVANPNENTFYLVPSGTGNDMYDEWIYVNNRWEKFGSASIDLSNYVTKSELEEEVYFENEYESVNGILDIKDSSSAQTIKEAIYTYPPSLTGISFFEAMILNKNLIDNRNPYIYPATQNGVTFTTNDDGSISFSGTPTAEIDISPNLPTFTLPIGQYTFSGGVNEDCYIYIYGSTLKSTGGDIPVQINANTRISIYIHINNTGTPVSGTFYPMFRLRNSTDDTYIKPLSSNSMWADFGSSLLYGGYYDFVNAIRCITHKHIDSYNEESLPGAWISDRDTYVEGTLPSTGASVTYELAEPEIEETTKTKWNKTLLDGETVILLNNLNAQITISLDKVSVKDVITKLNNDLGTMAFEDDAPSDNVEYVRKNGIWAVSSGGGGGSGGQTVWGAIVGTLSQQTDLQNALNAKADQSSTYTKNEVNNLLSSKQDELTFDSTPTDNSTNPVKSGGIKTALDGKVNIADLGDLAIQDSVDFATQVTNKPSAYPPTAHNHDDRYYTETEVDTLVDGLQDQIDNINNFAIHICTSTEYDETTHIPTITNPNETTFYLVPNGTGNDVYDEWIYVNNAWEKFGSARIDLSQYYTKTQTDELLSEKANESIIADEWRNIKAYNIGDIVIYNHELYKFTENVTSKLEQIPVVEINTTYHKDELFTYLNAVYKVLLNGTSYSGSDANLPNVIQFWLATEEIEIVNVKEYISGESYQVGDVVKVGNEYYIVTVAGSPTEWNPSAVSKINIADNLNTKADVTSVYTKTETDNLLNSKQDTVTFDNTPTENSDNPVKSGGIKTALDGKVNIADLGDLAIQDSVDFATQVTNKPSAYPPTAHNHDDRYYTETEVDTLVDGLQDQIDNINNFAIHICTSTEYDETTHIPTITNPNETTFYLVPNGTGNDVYDEWIYVNNAWEKFGSARIDLSQYYTKTQTDELLSEKANESIIADEWRNIKAYNIGDIVIYNHELYKFTENVTSNVELIPVVNINITYYKDEFFTYSNAVYKVLIDYVEYYYSITDASIRGSLNDGQIEIVNVKEYISGGTYEVGDVVKVDNEYYVVTVAGSYVEWNPAIVSKINIADNLYAKSEIDDMLSSKQDTLTFDTAPTAGSANPVTSGGVYTAIENAGGSGGSEWGQISGIISNQRDLQTALNNKQDNLTFDSAPTADSANPVTSGGVKTALDAKQNKLTFDNTPTALSGKPVTSGGVKTALDGKQDKLTFDSTPTASSNNPVTSNGIKVALDGKSNTNHNHDNRYYTESEIDTELNKKANITDLGLLAYKNKVLFTDITNPDSNFNVFYVSVNGNDNNIGSKQNPFATIQKAIDSVSPLSKGKIYIASGTYNKGFSVIDKNIDLFVSGDNSDIVINGSCGTYYTRLWTVFIGPRSNVNIQSGNWDIVGVPNQYGVSGALLVDNSTAIFKCPIKITDYTDVNMIDIYYGGKLVIDNTLTLHTNHDSRGIYSSYGTNTYIKNITVNGVFDSINKFIVANCGIVMYGTTNYSDFITESYGGKVFSN